MKEVKIYTIVSDQLSPPITGESFCTDMVRHSDYAELEAKYAALRDDMRDAREQLAAAEQERENWRISFDNERYRADKLAAALNAEHEQLVMANRSLITQHIRANSAESRIAELESRTVNLSKLSVGEVMHMSGFSRDYAEGWCAGNDNAIHEIRTAGLKVKES
ncbi:hypothetical protein GWZ41_07575 [Salmonella enterica subsp. enterica]|nr:hypothetical protein [Salmonella enterica subsp. enterica serovar Concord]